MDYKLAKQLKDAGFPFKRYNGGVTAYKISPYALKEAVLDDYTQPTLEEVIEELGDREISINRVEGVWIAEIWHNPRAPMGPKLLLCEQHKGKTPLEAVSNLYIKLNDNKNK